jgi:hypothetical protein
VSANALLYWMSARSGGSWQQFRAGVEELHLVEDENLSGEGDDSPDQFALPLYQELRFNMQRVGHAEFFSGAGDKDWRVTPPSLATIQSESGWLGILAGARSLTLLQAFRAAISAASADLKVFEHGGYPDQFLVHANSETALTDIAHRAGLELQRDAPAAILASLPPIDDQNLRYHTELPFGAAWRIDRYSPDKLVWQSATLADAKSAIAGLFRFSLSHQRYILLCMKGAAFRVPGQVGKYLILRRRRRRLAVLRYERNLRALCVPAAFRPPFLIERALVLCSGEPPAYADGTLRYRAIPPAIAAITAALLRQELI